MATRILQLSSSSGILTTVEVVRETEKAILVKGNASEAWYPKSALEWANSLKLVAQIASWFRPTLKHQFLWEAPLKYPTRFPHPDEIPALPESTDDVKIITQYELNQAMYGIPLGDGTYHYGFDTQPDWDTHCKDLRVWTSRYDAHYYARPKEEFFIHRAVAEAEELGLKIVVVDNLS